MTLGFGYEARGRLSGGADQPVLKRAEAFLEAPIGEAMAERERRSQLVLVLDDAVTGAVARLKERGFESPYLRAFGWWHEANPLRFSKGAAPVFDDLLGADDKERARIDRRR